MIRTILIHKLKKKLLHVSKYLTRGKQVMTDWESSFEVQGQIYYVTARQLSETDAN